MTERMVTKERIEGFGRHLREEEREKGTIEKYLREVYHFAAWLEGKQAEKENILEWKEEQRRSGHRPVTINGKISALNSFFRYMGWEGCRMKYLKLQHRVFRSREKELGREEYLRLLETARKAGRERLALLMETICGTGIRVGEVKYITVEAAQMGHTEIALKGKIRTILLPGKLCRKLKKYAKNQKIASGEIFITRSGRSIGRRQIWAEMKSLCQKAEVASSKVYPHNLRHLFARTFYRCSHDIAKLADVLGHSSIETTRIYLMASGLEHAQQLERLKLIC